MSDREEFFLAAWIDGIELASPKYFKVPQGGYEKAQDKWEVVPQWDFITDAYQTMSHGEKTFLGSMISFYNPELGEKLLRHSGDRTPCEVAMVLDERRRKVIAELMQTYGGW